MRGSIPARAFAIFLAVISSAAVAVSSTHSWQDEFGIAGCRLATTGSNPYAVLEPGYRLVLEGGGVRLQITVLDQTEIVAGVATRVVEEREWKNGALVEVARNYFALCEQTRDILYFGEDVDFYANGKVVRHDGSWRSGVDGNRPGLMMPGSPKPKLRYYQEIAPGVAMDRAEIISLDEICTTPAGTFRRCMKIRESSAIDASAKEVKYYAPGIGLVRDARLRLIQYGFVDAQARRPNAR